ncbi:hypothetical protein JX265_007938 [Neoarthrinium moseri]|uniref:Dienelactone hydrolase domain-containing protein n=1 Tax=Neoarthrinium moseri TaxID=1658444 RepID=A0A9Q0AP34_9PEZI|nr:uncharacterized protein JN550_006516 [Neoarthrinium moseri]KAI1849599.1 hypothetical protein JX266_004548 [Neoarthrinium moseri]KAI1865615.1 hypothetical protein JX265_007938 [Neoarthrinium moseri]KAI1868028.1 hypothetical protein JN550_006516 [Neoarthrinium moseri]
MPSLDPERQSRILVTGANGFIGNHIIKLLLEKTQHQVHAVVRTPEKSLALQKVHGHSPRLTVHIVPDITAPDAFVQPAQLCHAIVHLASPFIASSSNIEEDLLIPSIRGVQAICHAADANETVKRLVYCSSFAAVFNPAPEGSSPSKVYTEEDWNPTTYDQAKNAPALIYAYQASKAFAEQEAWNLSKEQNRWDMVSLCPGVVFGPPVEGTISTVTELGQSNGIIWGLFDQETVPETKVPVWTSVASLAEANISALTTPDAGGERFLLVNGSYENQELCDLIRASNVNHTTKDRLPKGDPGHRTHELWRADGSKAAQYLSFSQPTLEETILPLKDYLLRLEADKAGIPSQNSKSSVPSSATLMGLGSFASACKAAATKCPVADVSVIAHEGTPVGREEVHDGVNLYITGNASGTAVLYLTDVFGINLTQNRLLADSFGRAGFLTVAPDLFNGTPSPMDLNEPGFNITDFLAKHGPEATDPLIDVAVKYLKGTPGVSKIGVTGYCFGGRYAFRYVAAGKGGDAAFAAHPSLLEDAEISAIAGPVAVAAAETDSSMPPERRHNITALLGQTGKPYNVALYSGTEHGFGVRANVSDPEQKYGKESAFFQAVRWFENWV